jgi:tetratricopeptide (TPR) repeat protein
MKLIDKSLKENDLVRESIIIKSNIYEQQGNITAALQTLHMALEVNPDDYFLLVELHKFMFQYHMFDQSDVILTKILNSFQPDEETLKSIVANSIKLKQFNIIKKILDFITVQNLLYKRSLRKFMDVAYYILIKDIITENKSEDLTKYLKMMIQDIQDSPSFTKIAEVAAQKNNKSSGLLQAIFMESKIHLKYFTLIDILLNSNRMIKAQLVNKCIELIDFEKIRVPKVYNILIKTLGEINMEAEKEQYQRKLEVFKRDNI